MKKRPLCMMCLAFLIIRSVLLMMTGGESLQSLPASSIFGEMKPGESKYGIQIQGQLYRKSNSKNSQVLYLKNNLISEEKHSYYESQIIVYDDSFTEVAIGETVLLKGTIQKFEGARNPGNFDRQRYYAKEKIYGSAQVDEVQQIFGKKNKIANALVELQQEWKQRICENMSEENGPVLAAMLLGARTEMEGEMKEIYQKSGLSHVLAISGLHISFIGLGIYQLLRKLGMGYSVAGLVSVVVLGGYVLMIGTSVSVCRAFLMLLLRIGADVAGRVYDMATALALSAVITVLYQPLYLLDAAFLLSYGAVMGILLVAPVVRFSSLAIQLFLLPILLWFYFEIPMYSVLLNMVVIPLMTWVLGLGVFGTILGTVWAYGGGMLFKACDWILRGFSYLGEKTMQLPVSRIVFGKPAVWAVILYYVLLLLMVWCMRRERRRRIKMGTVVAFCVVAFCVFWRFPNGKLQITMLDVGQGDCIFMRGPTGHTYLIDAGSSDIDKVGQYRVEPFLKSQGVGRLDYVFVSHGDADHCNGIAEMLERQRFGVRIGTLVLPTNYEKDEKLLQLIKIAYAQSVDVVCIDMGQKIIEEELMLQCLQPTKEFAESGNAGSMVLKVSFRKFEFLLTGDVEGEGEVLLTEQEGTGVCDVLKVAHHGSKMSTSKELLDVVRPKIALISAGRGNSYGHPHKETLLRLEEIGCKLYQTPEMGAIQLETDGEFIDIFPSSI